MNSIIYYLISAYSDFLWFLLDHCIGNCCSIDNDSVDVKKPKYNTFANITPINSTSTTAFPDTTTAAAAAFSTGNYISAVSHLSGTF